MQKLLIKLITLAAGMLAIWPAAQSQNVGIGTTKPLARLHVSDSSVLFSVAGFGSNATAGNPPIFGNSRRLLWYADKGAFRAGHTFGIDDSKDSIGLGSVGLGPFAKAKGESSAAIGNNAQALGNYSLAFGISTIASGDYAMAIGNTAEASGLQSTAFGFGVQASGIESMAFGAFTKAPSYYETAMGVFNRNYTPTEPNGWSPTDRIFSIGIGQSEDSRRNALTILKNGRTGIGISTPLARLHVSDSSVLFSAAGGPPVAANPPPTSGGGRRMMWYADKAAFRAGYVSDNQWDKDLVGNYSVAMGQDASASNLAGVALGAEAVAVGSYSTALGSSAQASGVFATALSASEAIGDYSVSMGLGATAKGYQSLAAGFGTQAFGNVSLALGSNTTAPSFAETGMGAYNINNVPASTNSWVPTDRLFSIGNGQSEATRSNALTILKNGNIGIGATAPHAQLQFSNLAVNRKIVMYEQADNDHQFYGFGVNGYVLRYQINDVAASHVFFAAASASTSNELMRIQGNGRVGIGTTAPDQLLTVNGNASKPGGGSWATFSDGRLKKNVADYTAGLDEILAIHPVSFQYNELSGYADTDARYVGIIAQEMEKILPATISVVEGDDKVKDKRQFDGSELTYTLINAVKQRQAQIEKAKQQQTITQQEIAALKKANEVANHQNELLQQRLASIEKALGNK